MTLFFNFILLFFILSKNYLTFNNLYFIFYIVYTDINDIR